MAQVKPFAHHRIDRHGVAHPIAPARPVEQIRRVRHRLGAAGDHRVDIADADRLDGVHDRLQTGPAHAIDGFAGDLDRHARLQRGLTRHVHPGAGLQHATHHHVADVGGRHARARRSLRE